MGRAEVDSGTGETTVTHPQLGIPGIRYSPTGSRIQGSRIRDFRNIVWIGIEFVITILIHTYKVYPEELIRKPVFIRGHPIQ